MGAARPKALNKSRVRVAAALLSMAGVVAVGIVLPQPAQAAASSTLQADENAAVSYATARGWNTGIAVVDTDTGILTTAGAADAYFPTESTVKVFIAARLLLSGQMTGDTETTAYKMITESDDQSADDLYGLVGGASLEPWIAQHYGIKNLGAGPTISAGQWGSTQVTASGMAQFYAKVKADKVVGPWLLKAMNAATHYASDGTDQYFGIKAADPTAAVKQGWGGDTPGFDSEGTPSTGFVGTGDRYAVAIYTNHVPYEAFSESTAIVNAQAKLLMPGGTIAAPAVKKVPAVPVSLGLISDPSSWVRRLFAELSSLNV